MTTDQDHPASSLYVGRSPGTTPAVVYIRTVGRDPQRTKELTARALAALLNAGYSARSVAGPPHAVITVDGHDPAQAVESTSTAFVKAAAHTAAITGCNPDRAFDLTLDALQAARPSLILRIAAARQPASSR